MVGSTIGCICLNSGHRGGVFRASNVDDALIKLKDTFAGEPEKSVVITSMDVVMQRMDAECEMYSQWFIFQNFNKKSNGINRWINKKDQTEIAEKLGFKMLHTEILDFQSKYCIEKYPVLLKPVQGGEGAKDDIVVANSSDELEEHIDVLKKKGYVRVLCQPYLKERTEYMAVGSIYPNPRLISYTIFHNLRQWPNIYGIGSFSEYTLNEDVNRYIGTLFNSLAEYGYSGSIDIEVFQDNKGDFYINEFNWRTSGRNWTSLNTKVYSAVIWYFVVTGQKINGFKLVNDKHGYSMYEINDFKHVLVGDLSLKEWFEDYKRTNAFSMRCHGDNKPCRQVYLWFLKQLLINKKSLK